MSDSFPKKPSMTPPRFATSVAPSSFGSRPANPASATPRQTIVRSGEAPAASAKPAFSPVRAPASTGLANSKAVASPTVDSGAKAREAIYENLRRINPGEREFVFTSKDFERVRDLIYKLAGISLSPIKQDMVYSILYLSIYCDTSVWKRRKNLNLAKIQIDKNTER